MGRFNDLMTRAAIKPALGNLKQNGGSSKPGKGRVTAGTQAITYVSDGQPMNVDWGAEQLARDAYLSNVYVMRCARLIAETMAGLSWVAGLDPTDPSAYDKTSVLANLLGPSTPQAPGGPNPHTAARTFWLWTAVQYLITGRFGWECQLDGPTKATQEIIGLYPLVSAALSPKPTMGGTAWFDGYEYAPATGYIELKDEQVIYCWRPSITDWRLPESVLQSATLPTFIAQSVNKYMANLLKNNLVATTMIISPPFDEDDQRRAWQDQFLSEFTGVSNAGKTIFGEAEADESDPAGKPLVQVERLATPPVEAGLSQLKMEAQNDICIAFGVPRSLIGDASQRCADDQTEILTSDGWKTHDQLQVGDSALTLNHDTGMAEWQPVEHISRYEVDDQPMLHLEGRGVDSVTNAPHRWPVLVGGERRWTTSQDLTTKHSLVTAAPVADLPTEAKYSDDFVELAAWYWTEGHRETFRPSGNPGCVVITQSEKANPAYCSRIDAVMRGLFGSPVGALRDGGDEAWRTYTQRDGEIRRWKLCTKIAERLEQIAPDKAPSFGFILSLTRAQLDLFINVSLMADGWRTNQGSRVIAQKREDVLEGMALACILTGRSARRWFDAKQERHYLVVSDQSTIKVPPTTKAKRAKAHRYWEPYTGTIWCPSTGKNASWFARRNGKVLVTGNTYANAASEYKNFWTLTMLDFLTEMQDHVNMALAPRVGDEVGWFDLSRVVAVQPPAIFAPPDIAAVIETGVADAAQIANILGIPAADATSDSDTETVHLGEESSTGTSMTGRGLNELTLRAYGVPEMRRYFKEASNRLQAPINTWTVKGLRKPWEPLQRERIVRPKQVIATHAIVTRGVGIDQAAKTLELVEGVRSARSQQQMADKVHGKLSGSYPESTLGWVDGADWSGPHDVALDDIDMSRRPGGRDMDKVQGIAKGIMEGKPGAVAPVVLVSTPGSDKLQVADGYHRTLARKRVGHDTLPAFIGKVDSDEGPWDQEMHDQKLNRMDLVPLDVRYDVSPLGTGKNWVTKTDPVAGLGPFIRAISHALMRDGHAESEAIQIAIGTVKRWASGGGNVTAKTRAKAAEAVAEWEALKAASHA